jgi:orotidine-5'-phosphate decarboxylase
MNRQQLIHTIREKKSFLCVGLDTDPDKMPEPFRHEPDGIFQFNRAIIDATLDHCVAYKINTAFYEALGTRGWDAMEKTIRYIPSTHFRIADAKRGDIGNTSGRYAKAFFETLPFDAVTVAPYMGEDSIRPFLEYPGKWTIVLGLTSNPGAADFEMRQLNDNGKPGLRLYEHVITTIARWGSPDNLMFVAGATQASAFTSIRELIPEHFLLVPGIGFQGGNLRDVSLAGMNNDVGLLVNVSRAVQYAASDAHFAREARAIAGQYHHEMSGLLQDV